MDQNQAKELGESLRVQLGQLNERSRMYSTAIWQLPFAYIGIAGVGLVQIVDQDPAYLKAGLGFTVVFGILVLEHIRYMSDGIKRAVLGIWIIEDQLGLKRSAEYRVWWKRAISWMVGLTAGTSFLAIFYV